MHINSDEAQTDSAIGSVSSGSVHINSDEAQTDSAILLLLLIFMKGCEMWKPLVTLRNNLTELNFVNPFCQCVCEWLCYRLFE